MELQNKRAHNLLGLKFGRLSVIALAEHNPIGFYKWKCLCECGKTTLVRTSQLNNNSIRSCGCLSRDRTRETKTTHNKSGTPLHCLWLGIKKRCLNKNCKSYKNYGARGVTIHDEFKDDFQAFYDYIINTIGERPSKKYSLDRIDNEKGYERGNLRWATRFQQEHNKQERQWKKGYWRTNRWGFRFFTKGHWAYIKNLPTANKNQEA